MGTQGQGQGEAGADAGRQSDRGCQSEKRRRPAYGGEVRSNVTYLPDEPETLVC